MSDRHRMSRRDFLAGGGAVIVVAGSGMLFRAEAGIFTAEQGPAYELWGRPWSARPAAGDLEGIVAAATLAANPHNSQPWLFRLEEGRVDLFADRARKLKAIDPDERELMLGLGCALENLVLAAEARGYEAKVALLPDKSKNDLVATILLSRGEPVANPLYDMIPRRRTNRARYSGKPIPDGDIASLLDLVKGEQGLRLHPYIEEEERKPVADLIVHACEVQADDAAQHAETASWFRKNDEEILQHRDGITIDAGGNPFLMRVIAKLLISDKMIHGPSFARRLSKAQRHRRDRRPHL